MTPIQPVDSKSFVDHELSVNLDSSEAFEGPEKLLEIWFFQNEESIPDSTKTLRSGISFDEWSNILDLVNCKVLSIKSSEKLDAFLLSESSLFVYDHKLILKTCGTTTTLLCLDALFKLAQTKLGWSFVLDAAATQPYRVFYSRRSFMFPHKQISVHKSWNDEVEYLNQFFTHGSHYMIGRIDNSHWHLYTTLQESVPSPSDPIDETFEILMTDLSQSKAHLFNTSRKPGFEIDGSEDLGHFLGNSTSNNTGLNNVYNQGNDGIHDAFQFTPCGYSSNTILDEESYYTLHVTPEKDWSYASFESNVNSLKFGLNNLQVLSKVINVFKPGKFSLNFFTNKFKDENYHSLANLQGFDKYKKVDKVVYDLHDYQLLYISFQINEDELLNDLTI